MESLRVKAWRDALDTALEGTALLRVLVGVECAAGTVRFPVLAAGSSSVGRSPGGFRTARACGGIGAQDDCCF